MLNNKNYCDENTCVALRELGYNYPQRLIPDYFGVFEEPQYDEKIHLYDAQKWLREEEGIFVYIDVPWKIDNGLGWSYFCCNKPMTEEDKEVCFASGGFYDSYEEALSEGIKQSVKILKEK
jgi:hypothetical protein